MELKFILESILFSSQKPLNTGELRDVLTTAADQSEDEAARALKKVKPAEIDEALELLAQETVTASRSYRLVCVAGSWQFVTGPEFGPWLRAFVGVKNRPARLSQPALETLAIIAYRQPVTRAEIEQIRGVSVDGVVATLLERDLVQAVGRAEVIGRPVTYGTTLQFLEYFGLKDLAGLPSADELRRIPVEKPEALVTAEPGLAPATPEEGAPAPEAAPVEAAPAPESSPANPPTST